MSAASVRRRATPDVSTGPDLRAAASTPHLALVGASSGNTRPPDAPRTGAVEASADEAGRSARTPQQAFGARLKSARERRGLTLPMVAESTKVAASHFVALERGDVSRWPNGLYRRAFFKSYVTAVGLPADTTLAEFTRLFCDDETAAADDAAAAPPADESPALRLTMAPETRRDAFRRTVSRSALIDGFGVLVMTLILIWTTNVGIGTGAAIIALCFYPYAARMVRKRITVHRSILAGRGASGPHD